MMISYKRDPVQVREIVPAQVIKSRIHDRDYASTILGPMNYGFIRLPIQEETVNRQDIERRIREQADKLADQLIDETIAQGANVAAPEQVVVKNSEAEVRATDTPEFLAQFFSYDHLPIALAEVSRPFCELAQVIVSTLPRNPERTVALRKLLEAKDCAVRAMVAK